MDIRQLRCFVALAEELHFGRAAARVMMEQSPFSRVIKRLEQRLGTQLFDRRASGTRLTHAGTVLFQDAQLILQAIEKAKANILSTKKGGTRPLRIALSDGILARRLTDLLIRSREEDPDLDILLFEVRLEDQLRGLRNDMFDAGFTRSRTTEAGIVSARAWEDPLLAVMPAPHPLSSCKTVPLTALLEYPLILCDPAVCSGDFQQIKSILHSTPKEPSINSQAASHDVMFSLVAAGYGIGLACREQFAASHRSEIVMRPIHAESPNLMTYLLRPDTTPRDQLSRFIRRATSADTHREK